MVSLPFGSSLFLATFSIQEMFYEWQGAGVFDFLLPALLIFAVVFGILTSTNILGGQRGINFVVAISVALLAMQYGFVSDFFSLIFPNLGIALAILLAVLIMVGVFVGEENRRTWFNILGYGALGIGIIIAIVTLNQVDWFGSSWWYNNWVSVLWIVILILVLGPLVFPSQPTDRGLKLSKVRQDA